MQLYHPPHEVFKNSIYFNYDGKCTRNEKMRVDDDDCPKKTNIISSQRSFEIFYIFALILTLYSHLGRCSQFQFVFFLFSSAKCSVLSRGRSFVSCV